MPDSDATETSRENQNPVTLVNTDGKLLAKTRSKQVHKKNYIACGVHPRNTRLVLTPEKRLIRHHESGKRREKGKARSSPRCRESAWRDATPLLVELPANRGRQGPLQPDREPLQASQLPPHSAVRAEHLLCSTGNKAGRGFHHCALTTATQLSSEGSSQR